MKTLFKKKTHVVFNGGQEDRPHLSFLCFPEEAVGAHHADPPPRAIGAIVCKQDVHRGKLNRGYIAMLTIKKEARMKGIGKLPRPSIVPSISSYL